MGDLIEGPCGPARFANPAEESRFRERMNDTILHPQPTPEAYTAAFWQFLTAVACILTAIASLLTAFATETPSDFVRAGSALTALTWVVCLLGIVKFNYPRGKRQYVISCLVYMGLLATPPLGGLLLPTMTGIRVLAGLITVVSFSAFPLILYTKHHMYK